MSYQGNYPKTAEEWWKLVDENWADLIGLMNMYIGMTDQEDINGNLTPGIQRSQEIAKMKTDKNPMLSRYLFGAWHNAPDNLSIHKIKGWSLLCDLLSGEWVLHK